MYTSGAGGTNASAIRGALRAARPGLLTAVLPQSLEKQPDEIQELLLDVKELIAMPQNNEMGVDVASRLCNSKLLSETDQLIAFAFHESTTVIEATGKRKSLIWCWSLCYFWTCERIGIDGLLDGFESQGIKKVVLITLSVVDFGDKQQDNTEQELAGILLKEVAITNDSGATYEHTRKREREKCDLQI